MNKYKELKNKHEQRVNKFPMKFAFDNEQFKKGMEELGLTENDTDKVVSIGMGGFIRKVDTAAYSKMINEIYEENEMAIKEDTTGKEFIADMFEYELFNHEYGYTGDLSDTLDALGISFEKINNNKALLNGLNIAKKRVWDYER